MKKRKSIRKNAEERQEMFFAYTDFHKDDILFDGQYGLKWIVTKKIEDGIIVQQLPQIGTGGTMILTSKTCRIQFFPYKECA